MAIKASTVITLIRVDDGTGYTILLSNEAYAFAAGVSAAVAGSTSTDVMAYKNTTQVAATVTKIGSANISGNQSGVATGVTGLAAAVTGNGTTACKITFSATTALTTKSGNVAIIVSVDGKSYTKQFSFSLALTGEPGKDGEDGLDGRGISGTTISYQSSASGTTIPTGSWTLTIPTVAAGQYLWTRTVITYTDNTSSTSYSVGKMGSNGAQGNPTGVIVSATEPTGKFVGMLWQHTGTVAGLVKNATYRWTGSSWALYKFTAQNIEATTLSAITANLGKVTAGEITIPWSYNADSTTRYDGTTYLGKNSNGVPVIRYDWKGYNRSTGAQTTWGSAEYGPMNIAMGGSGGAAGIGLTDLLNLSNHRGVLGNLTTTINNLSNRIATLERNALCVKGSIPSANLDTITTQGIYQLTGQTITLNVRDFVASTVGRDKVTPHRQQYWGNLIVLPYYNMQLLEINSWNAGHPDLLVRIKGGTPAQWTAWTRLGNWDMS